MPHKKLLGVRLGVRKEKRIIKAYRAGYKLHEIMSDFGVCCYTIYAVLERHGIRSSRQIKMGRPRKRNYLYAKLSKHSTSAKNAKAAIRMRRIRLIKRTTKPVKVGLFGRIARLILGD